jgi:hypothetical protein
LLVCVLKGAIFFADLMRRIEIPVEVDFMAVASYGSATDSSCVVRILKDLDTPRGSRRVDRRGHRRPGRKGIESDQSWKEVHRRLWAGVRNTAALIVKDE